MQCHFRILDVDLLLDGPESSIAPVVHAYRRFRIDDGVSHPIRISIGEDRIVIGERTVPLADGLDPGIQTYSSLLGAALDATPRYAVFHAAVLADPRGRGMLIAGPSGQGKSSLTLEMIARGFRFLSDDYAPVDLAARTVAPYPRTVAVLPGGTAPLPAPMRVAAQRPDAPMLFGKVALDIGSVFGESTIVREPVPIGSVVLLDARQNARGPHPEVSWMDVGVVEARASDLRDRLLAIEGVVIETERSARGLRIWRLRFEHGRCPSPKVSELIENEAVVYAEKSWNARQDFDAPPEVAPVPRRDAALLLGQELLNRRPSSRLLRDRGGDLAALTLEIGAALRDANCRRVRVGRFTETADLLERIAAGEI